MSLVTSLLMIGLFFTSYLVLVNCLQFNSEFYFEDKNDRKQTTQIVHATQAPRHRNCGIHCNRRSDCQGFNYNPDTQECQLLMWPDNQTIVAEGYSITCADNPCENGGTCQDRQRHIEQYKCDCSQGWCGRRCEELHYNITLNYCTLGGDITSKRVASPEDCLRWCLQTSGCKSIDIFTNNDCYLNVNDHTETSLSYWSGFSHYYPLKECNNEP
ncbi:uncharacterized protein LOC143223246 isoform X2 [Tachypleus tridentatus]|uniref:uncharacterized protein LOC143223246 isoform X2 n=1 Tax=Tachypleus tridentatus TaxID=6853 RepID=UPI003FCF18F9